MDSPKPTPAPSQRPGHPAGGIAATVSRGIPAAAISAQLLAKARADNAAEKLKAMVSNTATVVRGGAEAEMPLKLLVPADIIRLAAGDMVPADVRLLAAKDLFLNQAALTGEALPVERKADPAPADVENPLDLPNLCFLGSYVESGPAAAVEKSRLS